MQAAGQTSINYFPSYEAREAALVQSVGHLIPCRHNGPRRFWKDFGRIARGDLPPGIGERILFISADPRDSLAFGSPLQVLAAACMCASAATPSPAVSPRQLAAEMEIVPLLNQPLRTLSGGESVKLALAKALALAGSSSKFVVASPFSWLSRSNRVLFDRVLEGYRGHQVPAEILALEGEDDLSPIRARDIVREDPARITFTLRLSDVRVALGSPVNAIADEQLSARIADFDGELVSPCLFAGGNGQGKSLLAKSLAGAIATRGKVEIQSGRTSGRARLLFQDVITQTLLRSFEGIAASVKYDRRSRMLEIYRRLCEVCGNQEGQAGPDRRHTLLEIKALLIAARLVENPPALILDEPDWGLTRGQSISLVTAVIAIAHEQGAPVILISHKPWWQPLTGSTLQVAKVPGKDSGCLFRNPVGTGVR